MMTDEEQSELATLYEEMQAEDTRTHYRGFTFTSELGKQTLDEDDERALVIARHLVQFIRLGMTPHALVAALQPMLVGSRAQISEFNSSPSQTFDGLDILAFYGEGLAEFRSDAPNLFHTVHLPLTADWRDKLPLVVDELVSREPEMTVREVLES